MSEPDFQVVFDGQLVQGADPVEVKARVAKLFKTDVAKVEPLFSGERVVIKRGLDEATALKYQGALERAGAVVTIVGGAGDATAALPSPVAASPRSESSPPESSPPASPSRGSSPPESAPSDSADVVEQGPSRAEMAEAGRAPPPIAARGVPSAPDDMSMADVGATLNDQPSTVEAPDIDTSHLTLSEPGADLAERETVAAPEFDLSALELAPPGTTLSDPDTTPRK